MKVLKVFEHQTLRCDTEIFTERHFEALARFNERYGGRYCTLLHKAVRFKSYVGVLQIGNLSIEILPKTDQKPDQASFWQDILLDLLQSCQLIRIENAHTAQLKLRSGSLFYLYLHVFLEEVEQLLAQGLLKQYSSKTAISSNWKGRVDVNKQVQLQAKGNIGCFTQYAHYDTKHIWHQILYQALKIMRTLPLENELNIRLNAVFSLFPVQEPIGITENLFRRLHYNRKTETYRQAMSMAELLLLHVSPDFSAGGFSVLGILFDMNRLFEEYIYRQLLQACNGTSWTIERQTISPFWEHKTLRPDIILRYNTIPLVIDTKWKLLFGPNPDDNDLRQIYVYQRQLGAKEGWLLYPATAGQTNFVGKFADSTLQKETATRIVWAAVIDRNNGRLNKNLGVQLLDLAALQLERFGN